MRRHPRPKICDHCGSKLKVKRYKKNGERFRKYSCPRCGFYQVFKKVRDVYH